jgi:predicted O-linked N-acetylglucosamine transferase (SPINDLY family)
MMPGDPIAAARDDERIARLAEAAARQPNRAGPQRALADALHELGRRREAAEAYRRALALAPDDGEALWGLGCALETLGHHAGAMSSFEKLVAVNPAHGYGFHNLGRALFKLGRVDAALAAFARATELLGRNAMTQGNVATMIPGCASADHAAVREARRAWAALACPPRSRPPVRPRADDGGPIRLGYVSGFFADRNWMKPVWGLINRHDRERFAIHLFSDAPEARIQHGYVRDARDVFHDTTRLSNDELASLIEAHAIDVLVDLNAYSRPGRLPLFALRPAPVQLAWFNMFATSGLDVFDALIGDAHVVRPEEEPDYTERIVRVPGCYLTFEVTYPVPDVSPPPCSAAGRLTFGCLAPQYKITPEVVSAWSAILRGVPGTRLFLKNSVLGTPDGQAFVRDTLESCGIEPDRVHLEGPAEHYTFLESYARVDVALDTFPYNGGTTTMEALWQGVPVLTFVGDRWASRISASLLRSAGLDEYVARDLEGYTALTVALARDPGTPARLSDLRHSMRERLRRSSVCDCTAFTRNLEQIYLDAWKRGLDKGKQAAELRPASP